MALLELQDAGTSRQKGYYQCLCLVGKKLLHPGNTLQHAPQRASTLKKSTFPEDWDHTERGKDPKAIEGRSSEAPEMPQGKREKMKVRR